MNRTLAFALAAGLATSTLAAPLVAQTAAAPAAAPAAAAPPQAIPAKVAIIAFEQAVLATNEGQRSTADVQKKYEPQKAKIDAMSLELDGLKKQFDALPASTPADERSSRSRVIDAKDKELNLAAETASNAYQDDLQKAFGVVAQKVGAAAVKYAQDNGFTMLVNVGGGQQTPSPFFWWIAQSDISQAVVNAYNTSSGIAAPPPSAPSASRPRPATTTPRPSAPAAAPKK